MSRISFFAVFAFTMATLALIVMFGTPPAPDVPMAEGFQTPILALEFAKSAEDLAFLRGEEAAELRAALAHTQQLDRYFPIAYAGMAAMLFLGLALRGSRLSWLGLAVAISTIPADWIENGAINQILATLADGTEVGQASFSALMTTTWIKWGLIGLYASLMSIVMFQDRRSLLAVPGAVAAVAVAATWLSGSSGVVAELMGVALLPFMLSFPVAAAMYLFRPGRA